MALEGTLGMTGAFEVRAPFADASDVIDGVLFAGCVWDTILLTPSGRGVGRGGGNGDIEMFVTDAECAV